MSEFFEKFGRPEMWKPPQGIFCGSDGCRPTGALSGEAQKEMAVVGRWLQAKGEGYLGGLSDFKMELALALEAGGEHDSCDKSGSGTD